MSAVKGLISAAIVVGVSSHLIKQMKDIKPKDKRDKRKDLNSLIY